MSPPLAYIGDEQWEGLSRQERARFLHLAPAFLIELHSKGDRLAAIQEKMEAWIANGVQLAWLIDPEARQVHIYRTDATPRIDSDSRVAGSGPVEGFALDLEEVWRCFE